MEKTTHIQHTEQQTQTEQQTTGQQQQDTPVSQEALRQFAGQIPWITIRIYDHSFTNGVLSIDNDAFENYLKAHDQKEHIEKMLLELEQLYSVLEQEKNRLTNLIDTHTEEFWRRKEQIVRLQTELVLQKERLTNLKAEKEKTEQKIAEAEQAGQSIRIPIGWPLGFLFLLAGGVFIWGEIMLTHDVVTTTFNFEDGLTAWMFALGLALTPFVLKPAFERIFEKPYEEGRHIKRNHGFLIAVGVLVLGMLIVMGIARHDGIAHNNEAVQLRSSIVQLEERCFTGDCSPEDQIRLVEKQEHLRDLEGKLANNLFTAISLVLAAAIFAIASTICLGIGFPVLEKHYKKNVALPILLRRLRGQLKRLIASLKAQEDLTLERETQLVADITLLERTSEDWVARREKAVADMETIRTQQAALRQELIEQTIQTHTQLAEDAYRRGLNLREQGAFSERELYGQFERTLSRRITSNVSQQETSDGTNAYGRRSSGGGSSQQPGQNGQSGERTLKKLRPYQLIRKIAIRKLAS